MLLLLLACLLAAPVFAPPRAVGEISVSEVERDVFVMANEERRQQRLRPLEWEDSLAKAARLHSEDMLSRSYFSHETPEGRTSEQRVRAVDRRLVGRFAENLWQVSGGRSDDAAQLAADIFGSWMESPGHRANILASGFSHVGVGIAMARGRVFATADFGDIRATLKSPLPESIPAGHILLFEVQVPPRLPRPQHFDLVSGNGVVVFGPVRLDGRAPVTARPGTYQFRFYFPVRSNDPAIRNYEIVPGPEIRVK